MPTDEQFLKLVAELTKENHNKPDYLGWGAVIVAVLASLLSFWASNAIVGERVDRLRVEVDKLETSQAALHAALTAESRTAERATADLANKVNELIRNKKP